MEVSDSRTSNLGSLPRQSAGPLHVGAKIPAEVQGSATAPPTLRACATATLLLRNRRVARPRLAASDASSPACSSLIAVRRRGHQHHDQWHDIALASSLRSAVIIDAAQTPRA
ncbi:hypothetical protein TR80_002285 [Xanthomonas campestris]|nr:hypothetical protein TR80_002285 [Xanthomonas campestris]